MNVKQKAQTTWGQAQQEAKEAQEKRAQREAELSARWLAEQFDGATLKDFAAQNIEVKFSIDTGRRRIHIKGECPNCHEHAWSSAILTWRGLGEMLYGDFRRDFHLHRCRAVTITSDSADTLRDALIEFLDIEL